MLSNLMIGGFLQLQLQQWFIYRGCHHIESDEELHKLV
jgi:hypothetical protein